MLRVPKTLSMLMRMSVILSVYIIIEKTLRAAGFIYLCLDGVVMYVHSTHVYLKQFCS